MARVTRETRFDFLLERGFEDISLLDISGDALEKAKSRLGTKSVGVKFITSDVTTFEATAKFDLWHDRATFHFLTSIEDVEKDLKQVFGKYFQNTKCFETIHTTPWGTSQDFTYCGFKKIS